MGIIYTSNKSIYAICSKLNKMYQKSFVASILLAVAAYAQDGDEF